MIFVSVVRVVACSVIPHTLPTAFAPAFEFQPVAHATPLARVQELAAAALQDGSAAPDVAWLAQLGSSGGSRQNVERDIHRQARI
eukprot:14300832-Alexandrium_andersonii.AAC.1